MMGGEINYEHLNGNGVKKGKANKNESLLTEEQDQVQVDIDY